MKILKKHRSLGLFCALLLIPFLLANPLHAQCTKTAAQIERAVNSCDKGDQNCYISLAARNMDCADKIAWYYVILNKPDNPDAVLNSFLLGIEKKNPDLVPIPSAFAERLNASIQKAHELNLKEKETGSIIADCTMTAGQIEAAVAACTAGDLNCLSTLTGNNMGCADKIIWYYMILNKPDNPSAVLDRVLDSVPSAYADDVTASFNAADRANKDEADATRTFENEYPYGQ